MVPVETGVENNRVGGGVSRPVSVSPVPMGIFHSPHISLALRNQNGGLLNSAIGRDSRDT